MVINSIHFTFSPKDAAIAESLLRELRYASRKEAGVIQYEVGSRQATVPAATDAV
jgi:quinol monooxygenase YgiN